jgi:hypothetical protein
MNKPDEYRTNAEERERMAENSLDPTDRAAWFQLAKRWLSMIPNAGLVDAVGKPLKCQEAPDQPPDALLLRPPRANSGSADDRGVRRAIRHAKRARPALGFFGSPLDLGVAFADGLGECSRAVYHVWPSDCGVHGVRDRHRRRSCWGCTRCRPREAT